MVSQNFISIKFDFAKNFMYLMHISYLTSQFKNYKIIFYYICMLVCVVSIRKSLLLFYSVEEICKYSVKKELCQKVILIVNDVNNAIIQSTYKQLHVEIYLKLKCIINTINKAPYQSDLKFPSPLLILWFQNTFRFFKFLIRKI